MRLLLLVPGIIRALYQENTAKGMSYVSMIMMMAPLIAPAIGSAVLWVGHWQDIFLVLASVFRFDLVADLAFFT